jgi:curved DNA-binding protein CbpA
MNRSVAMAKSLYEILGIKKNASKDDIKKAYRSKVKETHPDKGGATEAFVSVRFAFKVLSDPGARQRYDETGDASDNFISEEAQLKQDAIGNLMQLFETFTQADFEQGANVDLIGEMEGHCLENINNLNSSINSLEKIIQKLTRYKDKMKYRGGKDDLFSSFIDGRVRDCRNGIEHKKRTLKIQGITRDLLQDYEWESEDFKPYITIPQSQRYSSLLNLWGNSYVNR